MGEDCWVQNLLIAIFDKFELLSIHRGPLGMAVSEFHCGALVDVKGLNYSAVLWVADQSTDELLDIASLTAVGDWRTDVCLAVFSELGELVYALVPTENAP